MKAWVRELVEMRLGNDEIAHVYAVADERQDGADRRGIGDAPWRGTPRADGRTLHRQGAIGEYAVAKYLGESWAALCDDFQSVVADVGDRYQVRTTDYPHGGLLLHDHDKRMQPYVLTRIHRLPVVELVGWAWGHEVLVPTYLRRNARGRFWLMPACDLRPMPDLRVAA